MVNWKIAIVEDNLSCPYIIHVTTPIKYIGCKNPSRWIWHSGKEIPLCTYIDCPLSKFSLEEKEER